MVGSHTRCLPSNPSKLDTICSHYFQPIISYVSGMHFNGSWISFRKTHHDEWVKMVKNGNFTVLPHGAIATTLNYFPIRSISILRHCMRMEKSCLICWKTNNMGSKLNLYSFLQLRKLSLTVDLNIEEWICTWWQKSESLHHFKDLYVWSLFVLASVKRPSFYDSVTSNVSWWPMTSNATLT